MSGDLLLYTGLALLGLSLLAGLWAAIAYQRKKKKLNRSFEQEYGNRRH